RGAGSASRRALRRRSRRDVDAASLRHFPLDRRRPDLDAAQAARRRFRLRRGSASARSANRVVRARDEGRIARASRRRAGGDAHPRRRQDLGDAARGFAAARRLRSHLSPRTRCRRRRRTAGDGLHHGRRVAQRRRRRTLAARQRPSAADLSGDVWLNFHGLILRSVAKQRVSKDGPPSSFETRPLGAPQDEGGPGYAIAFLRFSSTLSRKPVVESHFWSAPTSSARSLVMKPDSTVSTQTFSSVAANLASAVLPSSLARWASPRVQAKIEAMELVEVSLPF